ncbi:MAG: biotin--[acetyl-CoA-carboxylase] ligase [Nitrospirae bacterium]|nr:biotin--[acetyl-CoA-carboxylase] ligase [Nitrospirota bacterium]
MLETEGLHGLITGSLGKEIILLQDTDSTNTVAARLADEGSPHGTVIIAETQRGGRGRLGRSWFSTKGNIYMSIILKPAVKTEAAALLTLMAGVACVRALGSTTGLDVRLKWPNDIVVAGKKMGGILTETKILADTLLFAVVGIGINVNMQREEFPSDIQSLATSVKAETNKTQSLPLIISEILKETEACYELFRENKRDTLLQEWRRLSSTLGKNVKVTIGKDIITGIAEDIDDKGMLLLRLLSGELKTISSGDVTLLR